MGYLRFYRRFRIFPGVWLNVSKTGVSLSFGRRGFTVTIGRTGIRFTAGLTGTGLFYTTHFPHKKTDKNKDESLSGEHGLENLETLKKELHME
jgi:hypothetical protein